MPTNLSHSTNNNPTDLSAIDNINTIVVGGYGGPHSVFDKDHYKSQLRLDGRLIEFNAAQGAVVGHGYVWAVSIISYGDDNVTETLSWPMTDPDIKKFVKLQMIYFIEKYVVKKLYLASINRDIDLTTAVGPFIWE